MHCLAWPDGLHVSSDAAWLINVKVLALTPFDLPVIFMFTGQTYTMKIFIICILYQILLH